MHVEVDLELMPRAALFDPQSQLIFLHCTTPIVGPKLVFTLRNMTVRGVGERLHRTSKGTWIMEWRFTHSNAGIGSVNSSMYL
jgi:hypothetical protein